MFGLHKARFTNPALKDPDNVIVECLFNPEQCVFQAGRTVARTPQSGKEIGDVTSTTSRPATLTLKLVFDTFETGDDVRTRYTDHLWSLTLPVAGAEGSSESGQAGESSAGTSAGPDKNSVPLPEVQFVWGKSWSFRGIVTSMTQTFTLFSPMGTPLRASVDLTMEQSQPLGIGRVEGAGGNLLKKLAWTVSQGQNLAWIAQQVLGDASQWRKIASGNSLDSLRELSEGMTLEIDLE